MYAPAPDDELTGIVGYLDQQLSAIRAATLGLTEEQARATPCRSALSVGGIVNTAYGLRGVVTTIAAGGRTEITPEAFEAHAASFALTDGETMRDVLAEFDAARAAALELIRGTDPDADFDNPPQPWFGVFEPQPTRLRYFLVHQIEETARHAGHVDIIREDLDGMSVPALQMTLEGVPANDFFTPYEPAPRHDRRLMLDEEFRGPDLDENVWFPYYLPHWSTRAETAATYEFTDEGLRLFIPPDQGLWCSARHPEPMRVSCLQSASFAGPVGSPIGQQPFADGLTVTEEQPTMWGCTPTYGRLEITMRGTITPRSMFAFWLSGVEDRPERSGEICVAEIFGDQLDGDVTPVGMGLHRFRDPALREEFATEPLRLDPAQFHTYAVDWRPGSLAFFVDGEVVRTLDQAPDYPVQLMIGIFDFPSKAPEIDTVPELVVRRVSVRT